MRTLTRILAVGLPIALLASCSSGPGSDDGNRSDAGAMNDAGGSADATPGDASHPDAAADATPGLDAQSGSSDAAAGVDGAADAAPGSDAQNDAGGEPTDATQGSSDAAGHDDAQGSADAPDDATASEDANPPSPDAAQDAGSSDDATTTDDGPTTVDAADGSSPEDATASDGSSVEASVPCVPACSLGTVCVGGSCVSPDEGPCAAGAYRCDPAGTSVEICNASGTAWLVSSACPAGCSSGLCTGTCIAGATRCNGSSVEQCEGDAGSAAWTATETCTTACEGSGSCALDGLNVTSTVNDDGVLYVQGAVHVFTGGTINSPTGNLTIYADSITVDSGGSIVAAPTGASPAGQGAIGDYSYQLALGVNVWGGAGGGYGTAGTGGDTPTGGIAWGSTTDAVVQPGSAGGGISTNVVANGVPSSPGGGVLRLYASTLSIAGLVSADGTNGEAIPNNGCTTSSGGGSGGGVLLAADSVTVTGTVSAQGGVGAGVPYPTGCYASYENTYSGGNGGDGRVKVLYGSSLSVTGTVTGLADGADTETLEPPLTVTSTSHPDPTRVYNDDSPGLFLSWDKPSSVDQGYFVRLNTSASSPPGAADTFVSSESTFYPPTGLSAGDNYFHIVPIDTQSTIGTAESTYHVAVNTTPPTIQSATHPDPTAWSTDVNPAFTWTIPQGDSNVTGVYYLLDHDGLTVPTATATFIPISQKQLLLTGVAPGVWVFHVVSVDMQGYRTKAGGNYRINIGTDPGSGSLVGTVVDSASNPVSGATVSVNDGLYTQTTNSTGAFNIATMTAGTWQVTASANGHSASAQATVTSGGVATQNFTLD